MSEYQYYEFLAIDRPLDRTQQQALRSISSRARITATSFTNHYEWGDFKGDPRQLVERWFDLHLYLANWGERRLIMRLPARLLDRGKLAAFLSELDWVEVWASGEDLVIDVAPDNSDVDEDWDDGSGWLAGLAPLRADILSGDLRMFYLLWLVAVQDQQIADDALEPLPGIGPLTGSLESFAAFFQLDADLVTAAAALDGDAVDASSNDIREIIAAIPPNEMIELLSRVVDGDLHVAAELRRRSREGRTASLRRRTVGELRERAREIAQARQRAEHEQREAQRLHQIKQAEAERDLRLKALRQRGNGIWSEIEAEIERRNASGYDRAASLLLDLEVLADRDGSSVEFDRRLASIRLRHANKRKFIERLAGIARGDEAQPKTERGE